MITMVRPNFHLQQLSPLYVYRLMHEPQDGEGQAYGLKVHAQGPL